MTEAATTTDETVKETTATETTATDTQGKATDASKDATATDTGKTETGTSEADKGDSKETASTIPDDWRELAANGDDDALKLLKRYGSLNGVVKALVEKDKLIRSGKIKRDQPDPKDEKAMAEWRKEQGIPDDPSGYKLPETVVKRITDEDKPMLASFTDFAHKKGAPQAVVDIASEWYFETMEAMAEQEAQADDEAKDACETELRKDWAHGEYKANLTLAKRYGEEVFGVPGWTDARLPDGRRLGDIPDVVMRMSDAGRAHYGDVTFANSDSEAKHNSRRAEIEKIRDTDFDRYESEGLDKELRKLIEKDLARGKR